MPQIQIKLNGGIQSPGKLGTVILKPTAEGKLSYAQNVEIQSDEYGDGVLVPGPALVTLANNSEFTGVPFLRAFVTSSSQNFGCLYVAEGLLGATNKVRRIKDIEAGDTPSVDTTGSFTVTHSGHSSVEVTDMVYRKAGSSTGYIVGKDATDGWVQSFDALSASPSLSTVATLSSFNSATVPKVMLGRDENVYIGWGSQIDKVDTSDVYTNLVLDIPRNLGVTDLIEWNEMMAIAYNTDLAYTFTQRKSGGQSGIILWDFESPSFTRIVPCPSRFISALVCEPDGNLVAFGGVDEGKTTIYSFTGYAFLPQYSYIGDMPRSKHSVDFDGENRLNWITADGQWCRWDKRTGIFDHIGTVATGSSAGGIFSRAVGGSGNEFLLTSGSGSTYTSKRSTFGNYIGDGDSTDGVTTPLAIGGIKPLPPKSIIESIQVDLNKNLASGEKIEVRLYKNGDTSYTVYGTLSFANDGAIASKIIRNIQYNADSVCVGFAWKMTDNSATAPGILRPIINFKSITT